MSKLPNKLSQLIRVGLRDLQEVERNPRYYVNMESWHEPAGPDEHQVCEVCQAGAVMSCTLEASWDEELFPENERFDEDTRKKLLTLDWVRLGGIDDAYELLYDDNNCPPDVIAAHVAAKYMDYDTDRSGYKDYLIQLADLLEAKGY